MKLFYLTLFFLVLITSACQNNPESQLIEKHSNSLINETSPYLLQHAHNPVNWYPWSEEAFDLAKKQDKLVLISVGYSACHWCHVMERETFEDSTAAAFMNEHFISIKVDREERPDVDQVYMDAVQLMTKQGGWPLNCFALPDGKPIYGGTYFSKDAWMDVLINLVDLKANQPQKLENYAEELTKGIRSLDQLVNIEETENLDSEKWHQVVDDWKKYWDQKEGGPNRAPKFPLPNNFEFLLHYSHLINDDETETYVSTTLNKMIQGGIYDQIGGGFARYSTDAQWKAPHFEKMLYDNAQLLSLYALAYQKQANPEFKRIIEQTAEFINSELSHSSGAFYSALDADSDGEEGKFYVWTKPELKEAIGDDFSFLESIYEINKKGKWENDTYILLRKSTDQELAQKFEMSLQEYLHKLEQLNNALLSERNKRIRPGLDNKSITSWNALCVQGLTRSYRALENEKH
ncbi:MAG: thioredoxin domain-containing protein, partial [Flavobacteriales bacterium]